jgi:hypothetical protein
LERFLQFIKRPTLFYSLFTGKATKATVCHWLKQFAAELGVQDLPQFIHVCACDSDVDCRFLAASHREVGIQGLTPTFRHIFCKMQDFVDPSALLIQEDMAAMAGEVVNCDADDADANSLFRDYLYANPIMFDNIKAHCTACNAYCPVFDTRLSLNPVIPVQPGEVISVEESQEIEMDGEPPDGWSAEGGKYMDEMMVGIFSNHDEDEFSEPPCMIPYGKQTYLCDQEEWTWIDASTPCVDHSAFGKQTRLQGPSAVPFYIFTATLRAKRPKIWSHEITCIKTARLMKNEVGDLYDVSAIEICTSMTGDRLSYFLELGTIQVASPPLHPHPLPLPHLNSNYLFASVYLK